MNKLHVIAYSRIDAQYACGVLEQQGFLNADYRHLREEEVQLIGTRDGGEQQMHGLSLSPDEVVLVDGWDAHQYGAEVDRSLRMSLAANHGTLDECARVSL